MSKAVAGGRRWFTELGFDLVYNPIYDATTARLSPYRRFQDGCIARLPLSDGDRVLCVGVGTGNEIVRIFARNPNISVVGVDISRRALRIASGKAGKQGKRIELRRMDAQSLAFQDRSFDAVLCLHVMGFLKQDGAATGEIVRVLKPGGRFLITYPFGNGLRRLAAEAGQGVRERWQQGRRSQAVREAVALAVGGLVNVPVGWWLRPEGGFYTRQQLEHMFCRFGAARWQIEEDDAYQEFVVWGIR